MSHFTKYPEWALKIFASLCFSQVKEQLPENLDYQHSNPPSFIYNGHLFAFTNNLSLIMDEPVSGHQYLFN